MNKLVFLVGIFCGVFIAHLQGTDNRQAIVDRGFLEEIPASPSFDHISSELSVMPMPTGPYQVGIKTFDVIDETRNERLIPIWIYFPTARGVQEVSPKVIEEKGLDLFEVREVWKRLSIRVYGRHVDDVGALKNTGKHPVIFFNHGNGMLLCDHAFLLEDLASHGYVVVSVQNQLKTDRIEPARRMKRTVSDQNHVILNNLCVFDWLKSNNKTLFYDALDLSKIGVIGYSMGANASLLWADRVCRNGLYKTLFPHDEGSKIKECIVSLDGRRCSFPLSNKIPIFMLIAGDREKEQKENGETELMQRIGHKFFYYKDTHHGSFSDHAYLNVKSHLSPNILWFYGSTEKRMEFFSNVRKDVREFLEGTIGSFSSVEK